MPNTQNEAMVARTLQQIHPGIKVIYLPIEKMVNYSLETGEVEYNENFDFEAILDANTDQKFNLDFDRNGVRGSIPLGKLKADLQNSFGDFTEVVNQIEKILNATRDANKEFSRSLWSLRLDKVKLEFAKLLKITVHLNENEQ